MNSDHVKKGMQQAPHRSLFNALGYTKEQITNLRGMPFGVKSLEKRQYELGQKLFSDCRGNISINATRLVVRALELRILDIDNLYSDED